MKGICCFDSMNIIQTKIKSRRVDIEAMRIFAAFFVIFTHTGDRGFFLFSLYDNHSPQFWIYLMFTVFCKVSVPLFFMITGALMLGKDPEPISLVCF